MEVKNEKSKKVLKIKKWGSKLGKKLKEGTSLSLKIRSKSNKMYEKTIFSEFLYNWISNVPNESHSSSDGGYI